MWERRGRREQGAKLRKVWLALALAGLITACGALLATEGKAGVPGGIGAAPQHQTLVTKVLIWKDCQEIAQCSGCRPVYKCRSCSYQRTCKYRLCEWGDICVWSPSMRVLPPGARIFR